MYAVDANGLFGTVVESARLLHSFDGSVPELIVVGVGYPVGHYFDTIGLRVMDLTPTENPLLQERFATEASALPRPDGSGGGPKFLAFLRDELVPLVDREFSTDPSDRAFYGHSLGGLLAFQAMLAVDGTFRRFIISSPALWWDDDHSFEQEAAFAAASTPGLSAKVFFALGGLETDDPILGIPMRMRSNFLDMVDRLQSRHYAGLELGSHVFENETHNSVIAAAMGRALAFIYAEVEHEA